MSKLVRSKDQRDKETDMKIIKVLSDELQSIIEIVESDFKRCTRTDQIARIVENFSETI
jgi:hypothetical protein